MATPSSSTPSITSRFWLITWLILAAAVIPYLTTRVIFILFPELPQDSQFVTLLLLSLLGLLIWLWRSGPPWRGVEPDTVVLVKDSMTGLTAYAKGTYLSIPIFSSVVAKMPSYPFTFEFLVEKIDTQTPRLAKIKEIKVRATCIFRDPKMFYNKSSALLAAIKELEVQEKLKRTDPELWTEILKKITESWIDDAVRDVVWRWHEHINRDPRLLMAPPFTPATPSELDPYDLSVNRLNLARQVLAEIRRQTIDWGITIEPIVFESIEIDSELITRKTRNRPGEIAEAQHNASKEAEAIKLKGFAEAEVRARNLALLLDDLLNNRGLALNDPLIGQVVRAAFYSDGEMIWKGVLEKGADGDGTAKTA